MKRSKPKPLTDAQTFKLLMAGAAMSNVFFHWKQDNARFNQHERESMGSMVRAWDDAAIPARLAPITPKKKARRK